MSGRPFRYAGYEIDRKHMRDVDRQIRLYPIRKARLSFLKAKWDSRNPPDYNNYRSPQVDSMPGAPEKVGDPTGDLVVELESFGTDNQNITYLEKWVAAMDMVREERLDNLQRKIIDIWVVVPEHVRHEREKKLADILSECKATKNQFYHWLNIALLEYAFLLLDEQHIRKIGGNS